MNTCRWERKRPGMESETSSVVLFHLGVLSRHFETYFPEEQHEILQKKTYGFWIRLTLKPRTKSLLIFHPKGYIPKNQLS